MLTKYVPKIKIILASGTSVSLNMTQVSATRSTLVYTMKAGNGDAQVSLDNARDLAGNEILGTPSDGATFELITLHQLGRLPTARLDHIRMATKSP